MLYYSIGYWVTAIIVNLILLIQKRYKDFLKLVVAQTIAYLFIMILSIFVLTVASFLL